MLIAPPAACPANPPPRTACEIESCFAPLDAVSHSSPSCPSPTCHAARAARATRHLFTGDRTDARRDAAPGPARTERDVVGRGVCEGARLGEMVRWAPTVASNPTTDQIATPPHHAPRLSTFFLFTAPITGMRGRPGDGGGTGAAKKDNARIRRPERCGIGKQLGDHCSVVTDRVSDESDENVLTYTCQRLLSEPSLH